MAESNGVSGESIAESIATSTVLVECTPSQYIQQYPQLSSARASVQAGECR